MQVGSQSDLDIHCSGVQHTIHGRRLHQSRDAIKTKIAMQCNQRRTRCSFRLKNTVRDYRPKLLFCQEQTSRPRLSAIKRAATFEDRDRLRKIYSSRLSVACTSTVSSRLHACIRITYSFEYQKFVCRKRKLLLLFFVARFVATKDLK